MAKRDRIKRLEQALPDPEVSSPGTVAAARRRLLSRGRTWIESCLAAHSRGEPLPVRAEPAPAELADDEIVRAYDVAHAIDGLPDAAREELWARLDRVAARALLPGVGHSRTKSATA
jgi:hypothetical protein